MDLKDLKLNRFGSKDANQGDDTKGSVYTSSNPTPKQVDPWRKLGQGNRSNEEDRGAPNVLTGTVITSCFIQTSALPARVEIAGNDITFYDDTFTKTPGALTGEVVGDTSRIVWTHDLNSDEGFIMEKRASILDTYDNVFAFYALPARVGRINYMFFGRQGRASGPIPVLAETNSITFNIDHKTGSVTQDSGNGRFTISGSIDGVFTGVPLFDIAHTTIYGFPDEGYRVFFPNAVSISSGVGSPEGVVTANIGSFYSNTSGGALTTLYVKTSGDGTNTGWTAK